MGVHIMNNKKEVKQQIYIFNTRKKVIIGCVIAAACMLLVIGLMYAESQKGKLIIKNHTDLNLESVKANFVYTEGFVNEGNTIKNIQAGKTCIKALNPSSIDLRNYSNANYQVEFQFKNHKKLLVDCGTFNALFNGNVRVTFKKTDDPNLITVTVKASNGLLPQRTIDCNETQKISLSKDKLVD